jgi:hypothetical protein
MVEKLDTCGVGRGTKQQRMTMQAQNALRSVANMTVKIRQFALSANSLGIA